MEDSKTMSDVVCTLQVAGVVGEAGAGEVGRLERAALDYGDHGAAMSMTRSSSTEGMSRKMAGSNSRG